MHTERLSILLYFFILASPCCAQDQHPMTREEVIPLLAHSIEMDSPKEIENYRILTEAGERAYPAMAEVLLAGSEPDVIRSIIPFFVNSKGDKTIPLQAMSKYVEMHARETPINQELCVVFMALGKLGGVNEAALLRKFVDLEDPVVRNSVEDNLKIIDKRLAAEKRRAAAIERTDNRKADEFAGNSTVQTDSKDRGSSPTASFLSYWRWLFGGSIVLLAAGYFLLRKGQDPGNVK